MTPTNFLFIRGLTRETRHLYDMPKLFQQVNPEAKLFFSDNPGVGDQINEEAPDNVDAMVEHHRARWLKIRDKNPGPWVVVSASLGGMVTMHWFAKYPSDFSRIVLGNSSANRFGTLNERFQFRNGVHFPGFFLMASAYMRERMILKLTTKFSQDRLDYQAKINATFAPPLNKFRKTAINQLIAGGKFDVAESLKGFGKREPDRILILASKGDTLVKCVCSERMAEFMAADIRIHEWAGHDIYADDPLWASEQIREWMK